MLVVIYQDRVECMAGQVIPGGQYVRRCDWIPIETDGFRKKAKGR